MSADSQSTSEGTEHPVLRADLDMHPIDEPGRDGVVLQDRLGIAPEPIFVAKGLLPLVALFDGRRSIAQIEVELAQQSGQSLPADFVAGVVRQLDQRLVLDSERFRQAARRHRAEFLGATLRPARHAGSAGYPAVAEALGQALAAMVGTKRGQTKNQVRGLIAPHIDLARGREGYSTAYAWLADAEPADLYVVFGTGHQGPGAPVTGLAMDWQTPLGIVQTDVEVIDRVHQRLGPPQQRDLFLHRDEHSLEFQMLFLQHLFGQRQDPPLRVAGFLTGHLPHSGTDVTKEDYVARLLDTFREATCDRKVCFVAGADLAHLGPFFGDSQPIDNDRLQQLEHDERQRLRHLQDGQVAGFHAAIEANDNPDRICGTTPMTLVAALAGGRAELLHYGQAPAPDGSQVVSFCSMAFGAE